ncbi:class I SAM-dependent DNA methyltransferase [Alkalicoccus daliensis]|uniref:Ubiquinone/menaquinone biosynthesis C-methylase UbiE n=1 Tax=Alkalicoccus daliensis TaxID=745820 RepID=A0A1H0BFC2_9BACI|nr:class I SAM-dependent methyltransferase [Alkalicoccus daliensis]SDN44300.1 Ubiquinone/menaquinone biosynthesis C-methylase UbiE [Alkalicoccus daliensis]
MSEQHFAALYDTLMEDAPYGAWLQFATSYVKKSARILDLACGTGTLTLQLEDQGFQTTGVDISGEMLAVAEKKARERGNNTVFMEQDMRHISGFSNMDAVTLFCDGLNYLAEENEVKSTFSHVAESLRSGGVFLFDVHSPFKVEHIFDHQLYGENAEEITYLWFCEPGEAELSVHHSLTFFIKQEDGRYLREDEELFQRTFLPSVYKKWLIEAGFHNIVISGDFGKRDYLEEDDRIFFKAEKK